MFFVQFPHPGAEHVPPGRMMAWNTGDHRRKFLLAPGRTSMKMTRSGKAELVFWGEWEPPSRVITRWPASRAAPAGAAPPVLAAATGERVAAEHRPVGVGRADAVQQLQADDPSW